MVFVFSLLPPLLSLLIIRKAETKAREGLRAAMEGTGIRVMQTQYQPLDQHYVEGVGYLIGDINCRFNARSPYIRCAINPIGPCQECPYHQPKE